MLHNLAETFLVQGRYDEAEDLNLRALRIRETAFGQNHPMVAASLTSIGVLRRKQGRYKEAEHLCQRALGILDATCGHRHPDTAAVLNNLGEIYRSQRRYAEAESFYGQALAVWQQVLGAENPRVAVCLHNLASTKRERETLGSRALVPRRLENRGAGARTGPSLRGGHLGEYAELLRRRAEKGRQGTGVRASEIKRRVSARESAQWDVRSRTMTGAH